MKLLAKLAVSAAVVALIAMRLDLSWIAAILARVDAAWLALAVVVFQLGQLASAERFRLIAQRVARGIGFVRSLAIHYIGVWFNQVLPTSLGGDAVKVVLLRHEFGLGPAVRVVLLDRASGFLVILLGIALLAPWYVEFGRATGLPVGGVVLLAAAGLAAPIALATLAGRYGARIRRRPWLRPLVRIGIDLRRFGNLRALAGQLWTSGIVHGSGVASFALLARALHVELPLFTHVLLVPLVFIVGLIPISFAGWGIRELGAIGLYGIAGVEPEAATALSVLFGLVLLVTGIPGGLLWLKGRRAVVADETAPGVDSRVVRRTG